jgi:hypothetical protein
MIKDLIRIQSWLDNFHSNPVPAYGNILIANIKKFIAAIHCLKQYPGHCREPYPPSFAPWRGTQQPACAYGEYGFFIAASGQSAGEMFPYFLPAPSLPCIFLPQTGH